MKIEELFNIKYGDNFSKLSDYNNGNTPVIKSQATNNGVIAFLEIEPNYSHVITVARTGSVGASFYQKDDCYVTDDCMVLIPKESLTVEQMLIYAAIISKESYKYNYSRKVTPSRLKKTVIPSVQNVQKWANDVHIEKSPSDSPFKNIDISLDDRIWQWFSYKDVFKIDKGYYNKKPQSFDNGNTPFIGATSLSNGITSYHTIKEIQESSKTGRGKNHDLKHKIWKGGKYITISNNGSVGYAFYQPKDFTCSHDVNPITIKDKNVKMNPFIAMFLCTLIHLEKFRWDYGRKWRPVRMPHSKIKLPVDKSGNPDWHFMEYYIKSLPYSSNLKEEKQEKPLKIKGSFMDAMKTLVGEDE